MPQDNDHRHQLIETIDLRANEPSQALASMQRDGLANREWVALYGEFCYNGVDVGLIGAERRPHLYAANSLADLIDLEAAPTLAVARAIFGTALLIRDRHASDSLVMSAPTADSFEIPRPSCSALPAALHEPLSTTISTIDMLASSFVALSRDAMTSAEARKYTLWCGRAASIGTELSIFFKGPDHV